MTEEIKIKSFIGSMANAKEAFNEVASNIEKHYEKINGFFSVSFENQLGILRKPKTAAEIAASAMKQANASANFLKDTNKLFKTTLDGIVKIKYIGRDSEGSAILEIRKDGSPQKYILSSSAELELTLDKNVPAE